MCECIYSLVENGGGRYGKLGRQGIWKWSGVQVHNEKYYFRERGYHL